MWFFLNLYLQQVLGYTAFPSGAALLPMTIADHDRDDHPGPEGDRPVSAWLLVVGLGVRAPA